MAQYDSAELEAASIILYKTSFPIKSSFRFCSSPFWLSIAKICFYKLSFKIKNKDMQFVKLSLIAEKTFPLQLQNMHTFGMGAGVSGCSRQLIIMFGVVENFIQLAVDVTKPRAPFMH